MKLLRLFALCVLGVFLFSPCFALHEMVVKTSVANLCALDEKTNTVCDVSLKDLEKQHKKNATIYKDAPSIFCRDNPCLLSQLLFGERILVEPWVPGWYKAQAVEQKIFHETTWVPCPGFVRADCLTDQRIDYKTCLVVTKPWALLYKKEQRLHNVIRQLSLGTCLAGVKKVRSWWVVDTPVEEGVIAAADVFSVEDVVTQDIELLRENVVKTAKLFLGGPYIWGGCSAWKEHATRQARALKNQITGVDCSNLVNLAFRVQGLLIPRNSHSQKLAVVPIEQGAELKMGDLIFFADRQKNAQCVNHVVMYVGKDEQENDLILESHGKTKPFGVRIVTTKESRRFESKPLSRLHNEQETRWSCGGKEVREIIYLGTFFTPDKLAELRHDFLHVKRDALVAP